MDTDSDSDNEQQPQQSTSSGQQPPPAESDAPPDQAPPDDPNALDSSFFPSPSHFYKRYTTSNISLPPSTPLPALPGVTSDDLKPPNVDWIVEDGSYSVFGETWPVEESAVTLGDMGVQELFDKSFDRTQSLRTLLEALLITYSQLINSLLSPPPSIVNQPPTQEGVEAKTDSEKLVDHIRLVCINMHYLVNELRPVQARETLKGMMRQQIDSRRAKTIAVKAKCEEIRKELAQVRLDLTTPSPISSGVNTEEMSGKHTTEEVRRTEGEEEKAKEKERWMRIADELL